MGASTNLNLEIIVKEGLKLKHLSSLVLHMQPRLQRPLPQRDTVDQAKLTWPLLSHLLSQHAGAQPKIQLDLLVAAPLPTRTLRGILAEELPERRPGKPMLRQPSRRMAGGRRTEDGKDDGDTAPDGFGGVEMGGGGEEELLGAIAAAGPGGDGGAEEVDGDGVVGGQGGGHGVV